MKLKLLSLIICFITLSSNVISAQEGKKPLRIADEIAVDLTATNAYYNNSAKGVVYSKTFSNKGSAYIKLYFESFDLKAGDFVKVYSPETGEEYIYSEKGKIIGANKEMVNQFWSGTLWSDTITVELHKVSTNNLNYGFNISKVAYGHTIERINHAVESLGDPLGRTICSADDKEPVVCYVGTEMSRKAEAVCRLLIGGGGLCTGWLLGCDGSVMTNNHCVDSAGGAQNIDFLFNYRYDNCAATIDATSDLVATSATFIQTDASLDFTLLQLPVNPTPTYGYLSLSSVAVTAGERIYIPQHPGGRRKEIAVNTDSNGDANGFAMVTDAGPARVEYHCDTEGGSSGSPVIRYEDHLVIAIHNTGGCANGSSGRSDNLIAAIGANMPTCGVDDNNPDEPVVFALDSIAPDVNEATDCNYQDIDLEIRLAQPASANADVTLNVVAGGTATEGVDFELLTSSVTFITGDAFNKIATVRVFNDSFVEGNEDFSIELTLNANGGDAVLSANNVFNITIEDDDYNPNIGDNQVLFSDDLEAGVNNYTITGNGTSNFAIGNSLSSTSANWSTNGNGTNFIFVNDDACNCDMSQERLMINSPVDFSTVNQAYISFDIVHTDSNDQYDSESYVQVSTDNGVTWNNVGSEIESTSGWENLNVDLSAYAGQSNIMISLLYNDLGNWAYGIAIDNIEVGGYGNAIAQTAINTATSTRLADAGTINVYDTASGNIMSTITNNDGFDYGCIDVAVTREGNSGQAFEGFALPILAMDKAYTITADNAINTGDNTITFYFTETEIAGWETAVVNAAGTYTRNDLFIYRGTESVAATVGAFGDAVTLTATFTGIDGEFLFAPDTSNLSVKQEGINTFSMYPNPVKDIVTIKANNNQLPDNYAIYTVLGQMITKKNVNTSSDLIIDAQQLSTGLYFVKINLESRTQVVRFIKE
ncbi:trypsin-like peptidase domain-containing protein [uncultured Lacinutrix sp.]|uniref:trypsin-like peptidase domain-containing protein n=1 Tax=uncultured Lacinutrix sp. TaxID=574032 RepID=UPI002626B7B9|nr:trypsin-like peptidase domain-containing protein [uncultured Lacinutrix sp.]